MSAENSLSQNPQEHISYSDVSIQLVAGAHRVRTESEYAGTKRRIVDLGVRFFRPGFNNIMFLEDGLAVLDPHIQMINDTAKQQRSFRTAYWHVVRRFSETEAKKLTARFEQNPVERFLRVGSGDGLTPDQSYVQAFVYGGFAAMDTIVRKGFDLTLATEKPSNTRKEYLAIQGEDVVAWRESARLNRETDIELASQWKQLGEQNPQQTRLMAIVGTGHETANEHLPPNLQLVCKVVKLNPNVPIPGTIALLWDIQNGYVSDEQIQQRLHRLARSYNV